MQSTVSDSVELKHAQPAEVFSNRARDNIIKLEISIQFE